MKIKPIILSGGSGVRLWPLSRERIPKQFFDIFNNSTNLFEQTLNTAEYFDEFYISFGDNENHIGINTQIEMPDDDGTATIPPQYSILIN